MLEIIRKQLIHTKASEPNDKSLLARKNYVLPSKVQNGGCYYYHQYQILQT